MTTKIKTKEDLRKEFQDKLVPVGEENNDAYYSNYEIWLEQKLLYLFPVKELSENKIREYVDKNYSSYHSLERKVIVAEFAKFQFHLFYNVEPNRMKHELTPPDIAYLEREPKNIHVDLHFDGISE